MAHDINMETADGMEWPALLECASPGADPRHLTAMMRAVNWDALVNLADEHHVLALLSAGLSRCEAEISAGGNAGADKERAGLQDLRERYRAQLVGTLRLVAELFRLAPQWRAAGLETLLVKGPALSVRAYGDTGMRRYGDLDVLVRQRDIRRATELMIAEGYAPDIPIEAIVARKIPGQHLFRHQERAVVVELHTERTMRYFPKPLPIDEFFSRSAMVAIDGQNFAALCPEDELVLICIHGAKHFWERLSLVADVAALVNLQTKLDWQKVKASAASVGAERMVNIGLYSAHDWLKMRLPAEVWQRVSRDRTAGQLHARVCDWLPSAGRVQPGLLTRAAYRARMRGGLLPGLKYLLRLSLSPTQEDWSDQGTGKKFGWIAALGRPFRLAKKYTGKKTQISK